MARLPYAARQTLGDWVHLSSIMSHCFVKFNRLPMMFCFRPGWLRVHQVQ